MKVRVNWLAELHTLLLGGLVVSGALGVMEVIAMIAGRALDVEVPSGGVLRPDALVEAVRGSTISPDAGISLRVLHPTGGQLAWSILATLPGYALTTAMLVLLWRLVGVARHTDPFAGGTAGRLRNLGWLLIVGGPAVWVVEFVARFALSDSVASGGARATLDLGVPAVWFLTGTGILAIGEVVRRGQVLRAELDEVV